MFKQSTKLILNNFLNLQIDQECKGIEEPASDRPFYYSFLHVL